jgi:hypothetical protein
MTRKILATALKFKFCTACDAAARKCDKHPDYKTPPHDCTLADSMDHGDLSAKSTEKTGHFRHAVVS